MLVVTVQSPARAIVVAQASRPNSIAARHACSQNARVDIASRSRGRIGRVARSVLISFAASKSGANPGTTAVGEETSRSGMRDTRVIFRGGLMLPSCGDRVMA